MNRTHDEIQKCKLVYEESQNKIWELVSKTCVGKARCSDGRIVEGKHPYNEACFHNEQLKVLEQNLMTLKGSLSTEYCDHSYMAQLAQKQIESMIAETTDMEESTEKTAQLKLLISALFSIQRRLDCSSDFMLLTRTWLIRIVSTFLVNQSFEDQLFLLNHVLRLPSGFVSSWATNFIQIPSPLGTGDVEASLLNINHCLNIISTILSPIM